MSTLHAAANGATSPRPPLRECDLVMKGGITSGVAYPAAVGELAATYRFRGIGGASAGAIAAAVTAAAEYGRQRGDARAFDRLTDVRDELREPELLPRLFAPSRRARPLVELVLAIQAAPKGWGKLQAVLSRGVARLLRPAIAIVLAVAALLALLVRAADGAIAALDGVGWIIAAGLLLASMVLGLLVVAGVRLAGLIRHLPEAQFGMVSGLSARRDGSALTEWLHTTIERVAGRNETAPLTFADLADPRGRDAAAGRGYGPPREPDIRLRMMTTDLTTARPVAFPLADDGPVDYYYEPAVWADLFPAPILDHLERVSGEERRYVSGEGRMREVVELRRIPRAELPVVVATRMSLSFPVLLAAVPVWTQDEDEGFAEHWISDGGIASNFPMHFFDAWVPSRPTFGLNLVPARRAGADPVPSADPCADVHRYTNQDVPVERRAAMTSVGDFVAQILDTMQNWTDTMQAELPGFRDRIVHIGLDEDEGGMNITMPPDTIARVDAKGAAAGRLLGTFDFDVHWLARYAGAMREIQRNLCGDVRDPGVRGLQATFDDTREQWLRRRGAAAAGGLDIDARWCAVAADATRHLLDDAGRWLHGRRVSFTTTGEYRPPGVLRLTPKV